jgi:hypothetical protein
MARLEANRRYLNIICAVLPCLLCCQTCPDSNLFALAPRHRGAGISTLNRGYVTASVPLNNDDIFLRRSDLRSHLVLPTHKMSAHEGSLSTHPRLFLSFFFSLFFFRNGSPLRFSWCRSNARDSLHCHWRGPGRQHVHGCVSFAPTPHHTCHSFGILSAQGCSWVLFYSRVAICDYRGDPVLDCYVVPTMAVTDYRTSTTGITAAHLTSGRPIKN